MRLEHGHQLALAGHLGRMGRRDREHDARPRGASHPQLRPLPLPCKPLAPHPLGHEELPEASTWPDEQRSNPDPFWQSDATPWHFVTLPVGDTPNELAHPPEGDAVTEGILPQLCATTPLTRARWSRDRRSFGRQDPPNAKPGWR